MEQLRMIHKMEHIPEFSLHENFEIRPYMSSDEESWTEICKFGLLTEEEGIECWGKYMLDMDNLVPERDVFFVCDRKGKPVATCTGFVQPNGVGLLHMLGAKPDARGHGLGYSMTAYVLNKLDKELLNKNRMVRLKSDDWRLSAVKAYLQCGFQPVLFDVDMDIRWKAICDKLDIHEVEMLNDMGDPTGVLL